MISISIAIKLKIIRATVVSGISKRQFEMKQVAFGAMVLFGVFALAPESHAAACANGMYRAGCAGPNGAAVVKKKPAGSVSCAKGAYRAGCVGPNGAAVARRPY